MSKINLNTNLQMPLKKTDGVTKKQEEKIERLKEVSRQFEAIFVRQMLQAMRKTIPEGGILQRGLQMEIYENMFDDKVAAQISERNQLGLAKLIFRQLAGKLDAGIPLEEILKGFDKLKKQPANLPVQPGNNSYLPIVENAARKYDLDPELIHAVIQHESGGNPMAVSNKGAKGLMQLIDSTAAMVGVQDLFNPEENIFGGARYLKQLLKQFDGDIELALAAYNAGPGNVKKYGGIPPFNETRKYVSRVVATYQQLKGAKNQT